MEEKKRSSFSGRIGFVMAAAGSAVGLGNIWRFPYLAAKYGGGIFLLVYILLAVTLGFSLMVSEIALGRKTKLSAIEAFSTLNKKFKFLGILASAVPVIILPYYSVIGGWVAKYMVVFMTGGSAQAAQDGYFSQFISAPVEPAIWFVLYIIATAVIVLLGVEKGVEKASRILMPLLVVLSVIIAVYTSVQPGALEGIKYYIMPDFSKFSVKTVLAAMGQMFYSLSLAMGIMITYGSYLKKDGDIEASVKQIEIFDLLIAFLAGLMIVPSVFVFSGGDESQLQTGPGLMFEMLPKVFDSMPFSNVVGAVFFVLVLFAALTSSISLMETVVSIVQDKLHWSRKKSSIAVLIFTIAVGMLSCLGYGPLSFISVFGMAFLDFFDFISNSVIMPIVAL
ncbi:MAG TPA: sodium-dependent transporter, partial [Firmicutes bacterium]|nr:sodium-dependent transporter [Bacillota bacterium]